jgi:hypothetical protein
MRSGMTTWACIRSVKKCNGEAAGFGLDINVPGGLWVSDAAHLCMIGAV